MFGVSGGELIILLLIGLVVLGPERLPRIANQVGGWLGQARRMTRVMKRQLEEELDLNQTPNIKPPPPISREPSTQPDNSTPRDDDDYSPAHGSDESGMGVGEEIVEEEIVEDEREDDGRDHSDLGSESTPESEATSSIESDTAQATADVEKDNLAAEEKPLS